MKYSGFADEASKSLTGQIAAVKALGWQFMECRNVGGVHIHTMEEAEFEKTADLLERSNIGMSCLGSEVANWARSARSDADFQFSIEKLKISIRRMKRMGTKYLRGMSFAPARDEVPDNPEIEKLIFSKLKILTRMCEDAGVYYLHENCMNYGGLSWRHTLKMIESVNSPALRLIFDTGNPVHTQDRMGEEQNGMQSSWEFYANVREFIEYVHIKDGVFLEDDGSMFGKTRYTFPGEGDGDVRRIIKDLMLKGYDGFLSIEPHMASVYHESDETVLEEKKSAVFVEYGKRLMKMVDECSREGSQ